MKKLCSGVLGIILVLAMTVTPVRANDDNDDVVVAFSLKHSYSNLGSGWSPTISVFFPTEKNRNEEFGIRVELRGTFYGYGKEIVLSRENAGDTEYIGGTKSWYYCNHVYSKIGSEFGLKIEAGSYFNKKRYVFLGAEMNFGNTKSRVERNESIGEGANIDGKILGTGDTGYLMVGVGTDFGLCLNKYLRISGELFGGTSFWFNAPSPEDMFFLRPWYYRVSLGIEIVF